MMPNEKTIFWTIEDDEEPQPDKIAHKLDRYCPQCGDFPGKWQAGPFEENGSEFICPQCDADGTGILYLLFERQGQELRNVAVHTLTSVTGLPRPFTAMPAPDGSLTAALEQARS